MRTIKELLKLTVKHTKTEKNYYGLCATVNEMWCKNEITDSERNLLNDYIEKNPPLGYEDHISAYYWKKSVKAPRLRWLKTKISKL